MSETHDREVRYETAEKIAKIPANFTGNVQIPELRIVCPRNQIVKVEIRNKTIQELTELGKLPTANLILETYTREDGYHHLFDTSIQRHQSHEFIQAEVHYREENGQKFYLTKPEQIKKAIYVKAEPYIPPKFFTSTVYKVLEYGRDKLKEADNANEKTVH